MADFRANRRELRQALISALLYPAILLLLALVAVAVLLAFVVPQFTQLFAEAGRELPLLTRIVAGAGELVTGWWWLMLAGCSVSAIWWLHHDWTRPCRPRALGRPTAAAADDRPADHANCRRHVSPVPCRPCW